MNKQRWEEHTTGFLHAHPMLQQKLGLDDKHVIVDRKDWEKYPSEIETAKQEERKQVEKEIIGCMPLIAQKKTMDRVKVFLEIIKPVFTKPYGGK